MQKKKAVKEALALSHGYTLIELQDKDNNHVTDPEDIPDEHFKAIKKGGLALTILTTTPSSREASSAKAC
ncbi:hypothetical protein HDU81_007458, partial [Chytriomyces hyalinus]